MLIIQVNSLAEKANEGVGIQDPSVVALRDLIIKTSKELEMLPEKKKKAWDR